MEASLTAKITYIIWMIEDTLIWSENYPFQEGGGEIPPSSYRGTFRILAFLWRHACYSLF